MKRMAFDEIYSVIEAAQKELMQIAAVIDPATASETLPGERWSIANVVEHILLVEDGICRICTRLLEKARDENRPALGFAVISTAFADGLNSIAGEKKEAPDIVTPKGRKIDESLAMLNEAGARLNDLRPMFLAFDSELSKFPHPFFGDMSAAEWLLLAGEHKKRHIRQMKKLIDLAA